MSGNSLREADKKVARRRQVYKPVLSNPFTNEEQLWPHVEDQQLVLQLLQNTVLNKLPHLSGTDRAQWPFDIVTDFNDIYNYLNNGENELDLLFVCNRDPDVPSVVLQQIPLLTFVSAHDTTLIQLPRGSLAMIQQYIDLPYGMLLIQDNGKIDQKFIDQMKEQVGTQSLPWLEQSKYVQAQVKLVKSTAPLK